MKIKEAIVDQIKGQLVAIIFETILMVIIGGFTIYKVNQTYNKTQEVIVRQGEKIDLMTTEITLLTKYFCETAGIPLTDFREHKEEIYKGVKESLKEKFLKKK